MKKLAILTVIFFFIFSLSAKNYKDRWFSQDKFLHLTTSFSLTLWSYSYFNYQRNLSEKRSLRNSLYVGLTFGFGKEGFDCISGFVFKKKKKFFSYKDLVYDIVGTLGAIGFIYLIT